MGGGMKPTLFHRTQAAAFANARSLVGATATALALLACGGSQPQTTDTAPPPPEPGLEVEEGADPDEPGVMPADEPLETPIDEDGVEAAEPD